MASRHLWRASGGISTSHRVVHVNRNTPVVLRAPMEAQGHFALESAMDELAYAVRVDPVELRLRNDAETDPYSGRPFYHARSSRVPDQGSGGLRLGQAHARASVDARRTLPHRAGHGGSHLRPLAMARKGAGHAERRRLGARISFRTRHWDWRLHDHGAGRRRRAGPDPR